MNQKMRLFLLFAARLENMNYRKFLEQLTVKKSGVQFLSLIMLECIAQDFLYLAWFNFLALNTTSIRGHEVSCLSNSKRDLYAPNTYQLNTTSNNVKQVIITGKKKDPTITNMIFKIDLRSLLLVRDVLYHKCCSVVFPTHYAVNIKFILFLVLSLTRATFISTAARSFNWRIKGIHHWNHLTSARKDHAPLMMGLESYIFWGNMQVHTVSTNMRKDAMRNKFHPMQWIIRHSHVLKGTRMKSISLGGFSCIGMSPIPERRINCWCWSHMVVIYG